MTLQKHPNPNIQVLREYDEGTAETLRKMLFNDKQEKYEKWSKLMEDPVFAPKFDMPLSAMRDRSYAQIKRVCDEKLFSIFDFENDKKNLFTAHEMLGVMNGSLATKFTV